MKDEKFAELEMKAKDAGAFYGIYSPQYAEAIRVMNDYWLKEKFRNSFIQTMKRRFYKIYYKITM